MAWLLNGERFLEILANSIDQKTGKIYLLHGGRGCKIKDGTSFFRINILFSDLHNTEFISKLEIIAQNLLYHSHNIRILERFSALIAEPVNVNGFRELARQALPKMYYDFFAGGAEDQYTLKENEEAFHRITIQPRVLLDVSSIDLSTTVLGYNISMPVMIAPTSRHKLANPSGEIATARAASACNTIMVLSISSTCTLEEVAACCNAVRFFQLYVYKRRDISAKLVQRAENNGYKAIVVTGDSPRHGRREADIKNK
ncbi:FMN-dependent dehydrogenase - like 5 [Theobroma cacao]|nr:FMN-dependent dehydrogenase - like 5 [Theobroma cacao]